MDRPAPPGAPAIPAHVICALLLLLSFPVVRGLGERTRPEAPALDCDQVAAGDIGALERCAAIRRDDLELMLDLGRAYEKAAEWDRAAALYRQALAMDPYDGDLRVRLGTVLLERGDLAGALREGVAARAVQPNRPGPQELIRRSSRAAAGEGAR